MRALVAQEVQSLNTPNAVHGVAPDEPLRRQLVEQTVHVRLPVGKDLALDPARTVLQPALAVGQAPEAGEEQLSQRVHRAEQLVGEEAGFQVARTGHDASVPGDYCLFFSRSSSS